MFTLNGIVYASEKTENIQIINAKPLDDMIKLTTLVPVALKKSEKKDN